MLCVVANAGAVDGVEVAQLYIRFPAAANEPPLQLKGFRSVTLAAGASAAVSFDLTDRSFSIWDVGAHGWAVVNGTFGVFVGASSEDIRLTGTLVV